MVYTPVISGISYFAYILRLIMHRLLLTPVILSLSVSGLSLASWSLSPFIILQFLWENILYMLLQVGVL